MVGMRVVRFALYAGLAGLLGCASGAPKRAVLDDGGQTTFAPAPPAGKGGSGGSGGSGSSGTGGSGGSKYMEPPLKWPDASAVDAAAMMDAAAIDAGPPTYTCDDGKKNGKETSADCGGSDCDPCDDGKSCVSSTDCKSGFCGPSSTCTVESCDDKSKNQDETDIDCGGSCDTKCALGKKCAMPEDCQTMNCDDAGVCACVPTATCDADECGGKPDGCGGTLQCMTCPMGQACNRDRECVCDRNQCRNNCSILQSRCCKSDGTCGCESLISSCN